jgi:putative phosphoribosyl transferase
MKGTVPMKVLNKPAGRERPSLELSCGLLQYADDPKAIALALPNGSLSAPSVLSDVLRIQCEIFIARDLQAPCSCPCAIGGLTETDTVYLDQSVISSQELLPRELRAYVEREVQVRREEIATQRLFLRSGRELLNLAGRNILLVDDGASSSSVLVASIQGLRKLGAGRIAAAIRMTSFPAIRDIQHRVDAIVFLSPSDLLLLDSKCVTSQSLKD